MFSQFRPALVLLALLSLLTGVIYPALITGIAQVAFPQQADGSLLGGEQAHGSSLIGQPFDEPRYFWSRPSATTPAYNGAASSGSNLGPTNPALLEAVKGRIAKLREADPGNTAPIPADLITASGSGLDPHISPAAAFYQVSRVATVRKLDLERVRKLVNEQIEGRTLGVLGEPQINILLLNLALDQLR